MSSLSREQRSVNLLSRYADSTPDVGSNIPEALCRFAFRLGLDESYTPPNDTNDPLERVEGYIQEVVHLFHLTFGHPYDHTGTLGTNLDQLEVMLGIPVLSEKKIKERVDTIRLYNFFIDLRRRMQETESVLTTRRLARRLARMQQREPVRVLSAQKLALLNGISWTHNEMESVTELKRLRARIRHLCFAIVSIRPPEHWTASVISRRIEQSLFRAGFSYGFREDPSLWTSTEVLEARWGAGQGTHEV